MHDELLAHPEERITIEELAHRYLMNPTTLKDVFKAVYGESIASHMKEHRMGRAAQLLRETDESVAEIARAVGYESQSRFTEAFREVYGEVPTEYRKRRCRTAENGAEFVSLVKESCGLEVDVISGEEEAEIGILGALGNDDGGIVDAGGASTEIIV